MFYIKRSQVFAYLFTNIWLENRCIKHHPIEVRKVTCPTAEVIGPDGRRSEAFRYRTDEPR